MSRTFAYFRVSTADQAPDNLVQETAAACFAVTKARTIFETVSGSVAAKQRKEFARLLHKLETGDVLIVTKLDRLGCNAMDVCVTVEQLESAGVRVHFLALGSIDLTSPAGKMTMQVINAVAEFERDLLIERTNSGIKQARAEGTRFWPAACIERCAEKRSAGPARSRRVCCADRPPVLHHAADYYANPRSLRCLKFSKLLKHLSAQRLFLASSSPITHRRCAGFGAEKGSTKYATRPRTGLAPVSRTFL
jgi:putative DNA-invertase from lambdoid prophage Rac